MSELNCRGRGDPADPGIISIVWRMLICGSGFGFFQSPNLRAIMSSAPPERSGGASGEQDRHGETDGVVGPHTSPL